MLMAYATADNRSTDVQQNSPFAGWIAIKRNDLLGHEFLAQISSLAGLFRRFCAQASHYLRNSERLYL